MSRVWIYQADRFLEESEFKEIEKLSAEFVASWTAHGKPLAGKITVVDKLFLVVEVDEAVASVTGCSIDKSVHFIKELGEKFGVDFFDRLRVAYIDEEGKTALVRREEFEELVNSGKVQEDTLVYNHLIQNSEELASKWKIPFSQSWHYRVFK